MPTIMIDPLYLTLIFGGGTLALLFAWYKSRWIARQDAGTDRMKEIAQAISEGAMAFLGREYRVLAIFVVVVAILLAIANWGKADSSALVAVSFAIGAFTSALAGYFGMKVATKANVRTTNAAREGLSKALFVAFSGGSVMGMSVVGLGILGLGALFVIYSTIFGITTINPADLTAETSHHWHEQVVRLLNSLSGFSLGASSIALFARVGGGIYTKAADVGADLVGKVEAGIPEDDPRNPAVIADNVGDNVGDVAGMGADLFESYIGAIIGTMVIGAAIVAASPEYNGLAPILLPLVLGGVGILASIAGTFLVRVKEGGNPQMALNIGTFGAGAAMLIGTYFITDLMWPTAPLLDTMSGISISSTGIFLSTIFGLAIGIAVGLVTEYYCATGKGPVNGIVEQSVTGPATNIIAGLSVGMQSATIPVFLIAAGIVGAYNLAGLYGVAIAAFGMLSTTGIQLAVDAYGPISDNAGGIAEMAGLEKSVREKTDKLDAVGNTTAAIGKGFAIASAALTALALFVAYMTAAKIDIKSGINLADPRIVAGLFIGSVLPYLFSSMAMQAVGRAAMDMIKEVRRQFREIPGLLEGKEGAKAEYAKCVDISTRAAIRQMILPGLLAILAPLAFGMLLGKEALAGLLAGVTVSGVCLAIFMSNAGGAWDNAKKSFEGGFKLSSGEMVKKGSDAHKAAVIGDTVGDPFKDTAGPSLNILIKLMSVVSLVIAPLL